jgi:hypothetical protein
MKVGAEQIGVRVGHRIEVYRVPEVLNQKLLDVRFTGDYDGFTGGHIDCV